MQACTKWLRSRWSAYLARRRLRCEMAELGGMGARELLDLGISRGDLLAIERGSFESRAAREP
ncbi:MAG TPA: DUF1127 domain-containing protein [Chitinolyticbacter sp.]|nr:DUF1127 domain-containing protein [Chitinolyticbacter sp.]